MLIFVGFYVYILDPKDSYSCILFFLGLLVHCVGILCHLGMPLLVSPLGETEGFRGVYLSSVCLILLINSLAFLSKYYECVLLLGQKGQPQYTWLRGVTLVFYMATCLLRIAKLA